jgi:hypothetical protein
MCMEWAENCAFCTGSRFGVVDAVHKERKPYYVGKENEFLHQCEIFGLCLCMILSLQ